MVMDEPGATDAVGRRCIDRGWGAAWRLMRGGGQSLMVAHNTLVSGAGVGLPINTLGSKVIPTLAIAALGGMVGLTMAHTFWMAVLCSTVLMVDVGMVPSSMQRTSHAVIIVRSAMAIVGVLQWFGYRCYVSVI